MKRMILLSLVLMLAAGCTSKPSRKNAGGSDNRPPALTVRIGAATASATLSTYSWDWPNSDGTRTGVEADGMHPLDMLDHMTPLPAGDERKLTLRFDLGELTLDRLTIRRWDVACAGDPEKYESDFGMMPYQVDGDTVTVDLPDDRGGIFEVHAYFLGESHGDGYYGFCVRSEMEAAAFTWEKAHVVWREDFGDLPQAQVVCTRMAFRDALAAETALDGPLPDREEAFFADRELVLLRFAEGSGSISHEVTEVLTGRAGITVTVRRTVPEVCTEDMAAWLLLVELAANTVPENAPVTVKII